MYKGCIIYKRVLNDKQYYILLNFSNNELNLKELGLHNKKLLLTTFSNIKNNIDVLKQKQGIIIYNT